MSRGSEIRKKIRIISDSHQAENTEYAIGRVLEVNTDNTDPLYNTCRVEIISSNSVNSSSDIPIKFAETDFNDNTITEAHKDEINTLYKGGLVLENVAMSVNGTEGQTINYPEIGSEVIVVYSRYQQPFITQYSNLHSSLTRYADAEFINGNVGGFNGFSWNILMGHSHMSLFPLDENVGSFNVVADDISFGVKDNEINISVQHGRVLLKKNCANIALKDSGDIDIVTCKQLFLSGDKILIGNETESLGDILNDFLALMSVASVGTVPGPLIASGVVVLSDGFVVAPAAPLSPFLVVLKEKLNGILL